MLTSFVADPFIPDLVRFHCPIVAVLKFDKPKLTTFKRRIWLYDKGDFNKYRDLLKNLNLDTVIQSNTPENTATILSNLIVDAASKSIPNKLVTIRPDDIPWFNNSLRRLIRKRNRIHKKAKTTNTEYAWAKFRSIRNKVTTLLRKCKSEYKNSLIEQNNDKQTSEVWFKLAKQIN